ncbi:MAG: putative PEP-binding protein [Blautia wexlerae]
MGIVDKRNAVFCVDPDEATIAAARDAGEGGEASLDCLALQAKGTIASVTKKWPEGKRQYANIGSVSDVAHVQENDAEGIGLFRSEFLFWQNNLGKTALPADETEQFNAPYCRQVLQTLGGRGDHRDDSDIGADKNVDYLRTRKGKE